MHSIITHQNLVALLNFVPLRFCPNWNRYEHRQICFRTDCGVSPETLLRTVGNQTQRPDSRNGAILLESYAGHYYGQLIGCHSLRELTDITIGHVEQHSGQWLVIVVLKVIFTTTGLCDVFSVINVFALQMLHKFRLLTKPDIIKKYRKWRLPAKINH